MADPKQISDDSRRIARNTVALYFRMFLLIVIGLYTARIVLNALGATDKGVYESVASFVSMMTVITTSFSTAVSRFMAVEIGRGDIQSQKRVFATANGIMVLVSAVLLLLGETAGTWYVANVMNLPEARRGVAMILFQFSLISFIVNLLSVPYNAAIISREKMGAFAMIGVVEGMFKLIIAFALLHSPIDKLLLYGLLMMIVAFVVRVLNAYYCSRYCPESTMRISFDKAYFSRMFGFAGWSGLSFVVYMVNTQGVTQLINLVFGVIYNTMRGISLNVEAIVRQFVISVLVALNPQITKSYSAGDNSYAYDLACKGSKYAYLIIFLFIVPFLFEAETILYLWLGPEAPQGSATFTKLALICALMDLLMTSFSTLIQADGNIKKFYIVISSVSALIFPMTFILYKMGYPAYSCFYVFIAVYAVCNIVKLFMISRVTGFPPQMFLREVVWRVLPVTVFGLGAGFAVWKSMDPGFWRVVALTASSTVAILLSTYLFGLSEGEKNFVKSKLRV